MDRKTTIKNLREIIRNLKDENLFTSADFEKTPLSGKDFMYSRVQHYIVKKLEL